jgi:hypothetical protein
MYYDVATLEGQVTPAYRAYSSDFIEQRPVDPATIDRTTGVDYAFVTVAIRRNVETIPQSFFNALADFHAGRVVDADIALNEPPPGA